MMHVTTDPCCRFHRPPRTWFGRRRFDRARGVACPVCSKRLTVHHAPPPLRPPLPAPVVPDNAQKRDLP